jgi:hypothetical protein
MGNFLKGFSITLLVIILFGGALITIALLTHSADLSDSIYCQASETGAKVKAGDFPGDCSVITTSPHGEMVVKYKSVVCFPDREITIGVTEWSDLVTIHTILPFTSKCTESGQELVFDSPTGSITVTGTTEDTFTVKW